MDEERLRRIARTWIQRQTKEAAKVPLRLQVDGDLQKRARGIKKDLIEMIRLAQTKSEMHWVSEGIKPREAKVQASREAEMVLGEFLSSLKPFYF